MGKEKSYLKKLSNRLKAAGLQKLRWYCEACKKQCRDDNGFKLHCQSEGHQRQMLLVAENPGKVVHNNSEEFKNTFLSLLRRSYNTRRVHCNIVYNDYISDKQHLHMNSTRWHTLTDFVKYLGREGYCLVDETPKGWYIQWIDRDPENLARQKRIEKMDAAQRSEEERQAELIQEQIERDRQAALERGEILEPEYTGLQRDETSGKIAFTLKSAADEEDDDDSDDDGGDDEAGEAAVGGPDHSGAAAAASAEADAAAEDSPVPGVKPDLLKVFGVDPEKLKSKEEQKEAGSAKRKLSNLELIRMEIEEKKRAKMEAAAAAAAASAAAARGSAEDAHVKDYWLYKDVVVKVIHKDLADGRYYKRKGVIVVSPGIQGCGQEVIDRYTAKLQLLDSKTVLKLDQEYLETVIPAPGGHVLVVNGRHRGSEARLESLDVDNFSAQLVLLDGPDRGQTISLPYEHFSKLSTE